MSQQSTAASDTLTIGVLADTHIPDRVDTLHPDLLPFFSAAGVCHILHAGDIAVRRVLDELAQVAPVTAAAGNRDFFAGPLRLVERMTFGGVEVALTHGHGGMALYLWDKWQYILFGYRLKRYLGLLHRAGRSAQVVVFGHTHHSECSWHRGRLLFNPGSASFGFRRHKDPTVGLLRIGPGGNIQAEVIALPGWRVVKGRWERTPQG